MRALARLGIITATAAILLPLGAASAGTLSGEIGITSRYVDRGFDSSDGKPAVQAGLDYAFDSGVHVAAWASSVDFDDGESVAELDLTAGYVLSLGPVELDLSATWFVYPGVPGSWESDFVEIGGALTLPAGPLTLGAELYLSPEYPGDSGPAAYAALPVELALPLGMSAVAHVGRQWVDREDIAGPDYTEWGLGLRFGVGPVVLGIDYTDTDVDEDVCGDVCGSLVAVSAVFTF